MNFSDFKNQFEITLNGQQEAAIQQVEGPILLLAVPGSGKTTVLVSRLGYMLYCCKIPARSILTMTYTVAAAQDMRERFRSIFGDQFSSSLEFRTINGAASRIIRFCEREMGQNAFGLAANEELIPLLKQIYLDITSKYPGAGDLKSIQTKITYIKNMDLTDEEIDELPLDGELKIAPIYREYRRKLREAHWMDYDDQIVYAYQILRRYPDILRRFRQEYRYLCVDEAQDTSKMQHKLIHLLAGECPNLFMVGDEDQSIYGFRAAYPQALMNFEKTYPNATVLLMEKNYRSTQQIVRQADRFIRQNTDRHAKSIVTDNEEGAPIQQIRVKDRLEQYERIVMLTKQSSEATAVLYRDNDSAIPLIDLLQKQGLSYCTKNMDSTFFSHWITQDITDILLFAENPTDGNRFLRIYYKLGAGISKEQATQTANRAHADHLPILDELMKGHFSERVLSRIRAVKNHLLLLPGETAARSIWRIENALGYGTYLKKRKADPGKLTILKILAESEQTPREFLARLKGLEQMVKAGSSDPNARLILSTIHSSKGLEYEQVILADIADGILPQSAPAELTRKEKQGLLEEERRLFYVAMTRAKRKLLVFRFQEEGLNSSFLSILFPESPDSAAIVRKPVPPTALSGSIPSVAVPHSSSLSAQTIAGLHRQYAPKARIFHKAFGPGTVQSHTDTILTIQFDKGSVKRFRIPDVFEINVLSLLKA